MKQLIILLVLIFSLSSCVSKKIEYQKVENIKILALNSESITISADAVFKNPNVLGGKVIPENIIVYLDNNEITTVKSTEFKVPAVKNFAVPLEVTIPFNKLPGNENGGILGAVLGSLNKTYNVTFKGNIKYRVAGINSNYTINHTESLNLEL